MIALDENRSKIFFKLLQSDASPIDGSDEQWSLPVGEKKGDVMTFDGMSRKHQNGLWYPSSDLMNVTWLTWDLTKYYPLNSGFRIFVAQIFSPPLYEEPGIIWVEKACLVREATNLDLKRFGIYRAFEQNI